MEQEEYIVDGHKVTHSVHLGDREIFLAVQQDAPLPFYVGYMEVSYELGLARFSGIEGTTEYTEAWEMFIQRLQKQIEQVRAQRQEHHAPQLLTEADCIRDSRAGDYEGKVLVMRPGVLRPEYWNAAHQLYFAVDGNGARAGSHGTKVFCINIYTGEHTYGVEDTALREFDTARENKKFSDAVRLVEKYHQTYNGRITCMMGPQASEMCSVPLLKEIRSYAEKMNLGIHMHVAQSPRETRQVMQRYGKRPVELLDELGYLDRRLHTAHITETTAAERALLAERGVSMALCTGSIGIINGEIPPAQDYMALAGRVGLGTDQAPGNNCNNLFNEMKFTSILHKVKNTDPTSFPAWKVLRMATIEAAQCMGMEESVGSLRAGKKADVVLVALDTPAMSPVLAWPVRNIVPNLVYSASGSEVDTVLIDGAFVVENGRMRTIDEDAEIKRANRCAQLLCQRLEATGWEKDMPLAGWTREGYY